MTELLEYVNQQGYNIDTITLDNKFIRFDHGGKRGKNGWLIGFTVTDNGKDYNCVSFGDWSTGEKFGYSEGSGLKGNAARRFKRRQKTMFKKIDAEVGARHKSSAVKANEVFYSCSSTPNGLHPYLTKKGLYDYFGARHLDAESAILVPCKDTKGQLFGFQKIYENGGKYFLAGQRKKGLFHIINGLNKNFDAVYIAEGFATAATITMATNCPSVVCFDAANLIEVARNIKTYDLFSGKKIIFCADNDKFTEGENVGITKAKAAAEVLGAFFTVPEFKCEDTKPTDFNDLYLLEGLEEVKRQVDRYELVDEGDPEDIRDEYFEFIEFFRRKLNAHKRDILSGDLYFRVDGVYEQAYNYIDFLESHAISEYFKPTNVKKHLARYSFDQPKELLIEIPEWDGVDRIKEVLGKVKVDNISHEYFVEIFKDWLATVFRRVNNPQEQNKLVVLTGHQGIGKDHLLSFMFKEFKGYFSNTTINPNPDENFMVMKSSIILNISEFDQTANVSNSVIKDMITKPSAKFREPYARKANEILFRTSFISSSNDAMVLRDHTGNRRFIIFNISEIDWGYTHVDTKQLLAQYYALYKEGFKASKEAVEEMASFIETQTPDDPLAAATSDSIEVIRRELRGKANNPLAKDEDFLTWPEISKEIDAIAKSYGFRGARKIQTNLKRLGYSTKIKGKYIVYVLPEDDGKVVYLDQ